MRTLAFVSAFAAMAAQMPEGGQSAQERGAAPAGKARIDTAYSYRVLGGMQQLACRQRGAATCTYTPEDCIRDFQNGWQGFFNEAPPLNFIEETCRERSTNAELPGVHLMLQGMFSDIRQALPALSLRLPGEPAIGSLPIFDVNAGIRSADNERIVIIAINQGLFLFAYGLTKAAAFTVPYSDAGEEISFDVTAEASIERLRREPALLQQFVGEVLNDQGLQYGPLPPPTPTQQPLILAFVKGIETFALAHEIAHLLLNHSAANLQPVASSTCGATAPGSQRIVQNSWLQEIEADVLAQRIVNEVARSYEGDSDQNVVVRATFNYAPSYYFLLSEIRYDTRHTLRDGSDPPRAAPDELDALATILECVDQDGCDLRARLFERHRSIANLPRHPHPTIRRQIAQHIAAKRDASLTSENTAILRVSNVIYRNTAMMWEMMRPRLGEMYRMGLRIPACPPG